MTTDTTYTILTASLQDLISEPWTIAQLNIQYLPSDHAVEFEGTYLNASGEAQVLSTEFPIEVIEAVQTLFTIRASEGKPQANRLEFNVAAQGRFTADFSWDQEIQDEDDHFTNGGTVKDWIKIRKTKYGPVAE